MVQPMDVRHGMTTLAQVEAETRGQQQKPPLPPLRWGIVSAGRVCNDFVQALKVVPEAVVTAVGARRHSDAEAFAVRHGIPNAVEGSEAYDALVTRDDVDVVYIGNLHPWHADTALRAMEAGKHVVVEKPLTTCADDTIALVEAARKHNRFLLEGTWTRFFPAVEFVRAHIEAGTLGEIAAVHSDFGFHSKETEDYPTGNFYRYDRGGGTLMLMGVYPLAHVLLGMGDSIPDTVKAAGIVDPQTDSEAAVTIAMQYGTRGMGTAMLNTMAETPQETHIIGTQARVIFHSPSHCPTMVSLVVKGEGRGSTERHDIEFPLPPEPAEIDASGGFEYPNSLGFSYEAQAVTRCIRAGLIEAPQFTHEESIRIAHIVDETREQLGVPTLRGIFTAP